LIKFHRFYQKGVNIKNKIIILSIIIGLIFLLIINTLILQLYTTYNKNFDLEKENIFYKTLYYSNNFLSEILKEYKDKKEKILTIHKWALKNLDKNLSTLKSQLPANYHLFLTNENFIITDTTFKYDQNFSLAFIKDILKQRPKPHIGPPICEPATTHFISFSNSYQNNRVFQVGYIFNSPNIKQFKNQIRQIQKSHHFIKNITLYFIHPNSNFAQKCNFLTPLYHKYSLSQMKQQRIEGIKLFNELKHKNPIFNKNQMYILSKDLFNPNEYIIFKMEIDPNFYSQKLNILKTILAMTIIFVVSMIIFIFIYLKKSIHFIEEFANHIKKELPFKETKNEDINIVIKNYNNTLSKLHNLIDSKEEFLQFAMHELKTPLAILSLNIDEKDYLSKSALKKLTIAYNDMVYFLELKNNSKIEKIDLKPLIIERIKFFNEILELENKTIIHDLDDLCIYADKELIERLIDNNISNAIKYSLDENIYITLKKSILSFKNKGKIKDKDKIFNKFYREDKVKGGFGIGLNIIKKITQKYNIKIDMQNDYFVIFKYDFKEIICK